MKPPVLPNSPSNTNSKSPWHDGFAARIFLSCCFLLANMTTLTARDAVAADSAWRAGVAKVSITPRDSMWLTGFSDRNVPAEGKTQDLFAKALALEDARGSRFVIVTTDLIGIPAQLRNAVVEAVQGQTKLSPESILLNASHTHCGPELRYGEDSQEGVEPRRVDQCKRYRAELEAKVIGIVIEAVKSLAPVQLTFSHARAGFAMNRRLKNNDDPRSEPYLNRPNPDGVVDHDVPVLRVAKPSGELLAIAFGYACHNTTSKLNLYNGDYAGYAQQYLEESHPGTVALFVMGCGGDQNGYPRFGKEWSSRHGQTLAYAVEAALENKQRTIHGEISVALQNATLDYQTPPTREQLRERIKSGTQYLPNYVNDQRIHDERLLRQLDRDGKLLDKYDCPIQVARIGDELLLIGLPGETVVDYSLRLKKEIAGAATVWVAGYCNDVFAYVPSRRVLLEGGYEAKRAMIYMTNPLQPGPFTETVEERIISTVHALHAKISGKKTSAAASEKVGR